MDFAENLKQICSMRKTNPTALCKELGLSTSKVNAWYGGSLPKQEVLIKLAEKLNCSVMDFFAGENEEYSFLIVNDEDEEDILSVYTKQCKSEHLIFRKTLFRVCLHSRGSLTEARLPFVFPV